MLDKPIHDSRHSEVLEAMDLEQVQGSQEEKGDLNENFVRSIQELQLFFEQYQGTHSER
ncbi:hypothetical protein ACFOZY_00130 [Chungangia koreensis]|uniref:Uncharacterized protein n=1 Tax=Chungangia koreensis TaxID=752657 RepID=A0ABV8X444_9LACT